MIWVKVQNFDQDVKVGDKISVEDASYREYSGIVTAIGERTYLLKDGSSEETAWDFKYDAKVWREPKRWRAAHGTDYYFVFDSSVESESDLRGEISSSRFDMGNYFRTKEQAQEFSDECKKVAQRLHEKFGE